MQASLRLLLALFAAVCLPLAAASAQVKIIIDTDVATDCDDAGALAVAHALQNRGECEILAVVTNNKDPYSIGGVDAINTWYGRGNIPLGAYKGTVVGKTSDYGAIAQNTALYGHDVINSSQVPDAVTTYRTVLAGQADASVVIVSVGWLNNLEGLLKSPADAISPLTGAALVAQKVKSVSIMGGRYPSGSEYNFTSFGSGPSTKYTVENWPATVPMMFQGYEIGDGVSTGPTLTSTPANNPVRKAYETMYNGINGRPSWDQCAVLYAVRGLGDYWTQETVGYNLINADGTNAWQSSPDKNQAYSKVLMSDANLAAVIGDLMDDPPLPPVSPFPVKVIFDTDYSTDCDDPGALAVLHALADNGEAEILATGASTRLDKAPGAMDVVNTYYGRPNLPMSATKVGPTFASNFAAYLYDNFPHDTPLSPSVADAVASYRQVLAAQPDDSVVFITVGYLTNVAELLKSPPDAHSPLTGMELVAAKVREWACMGGNFWTSSTDNVNFSRDTAAAQYAIENFPKKLTFIPREVASVPSPLRAGEELNETPLTNPVRIAYHKYFGRTTNIDRHVADLATVLYAVRGEHDYWDMHTNGSMTNITSAGTFTWDASGVKDHNYLVMKGGYGVYSNKTYVEGVIRNLLKQTPAAVAGIHGPAISSHPQGVSGPAGQRASFAVVATANPPPSYQWQKNGAAIPGATGSVYTTPPTVTADTGAVYRVVITNSEGSVTSNGATLTVLSDGGPLPGTWSSSDIGSTGLAGSAGYGNGVFTVKGAGEDIAGTADSFHFARQTVTGNFDIRARVTSQTDTDAWAKAGVMVRETLQPGARRVFLAITPGNGFRFQERAEPDAMSPGSLACGALNPKPNNWVRLVRSGNTFTAYTSPDGTGWTEVASTSISMAASVYAGLAVTSHEPTLLSTATFDQVLITSDTAPPFGVLLGHYRFDETAGSPIINQGTAGAVLNLTNTGGAQGRDNTGTGGYGATDYNGYGSAFNVLASGDGAYHTATSSAGGGLLTSGGVSQSSLQGADGAFTYEALIKISSTTGEQTILAHDGTNIRGFLFRVNAGTLSLYTGPATPTAPIPTTGAHAFAANAWFHVAVTYTGAEGVSGNLKFYWTALDSPASSANIIGTATLAADLDSSVSNVLGVGTTTRNFFRFELGGLVDEVRISGVALAPDAFAVFAAPPFDTSGDGIPDAWAAANGLDPAVNNASGDLNRDGIPHLLEFAFGFGSTPASIADLPVVEVEDDHLTLTAALNPEATHLLFVPEVSGDLVTWYSGPEHVTIAEQTPTLLRAVDNQPISGSPKRTMRLRVVAPAQ